MIVKRGSSRQDVGKKRIGLPFGNDSPTLGTGRGVGHLRREKVGSEQFVNPVAKVLAQEIGFVRVSLGQNPFQSYRCIKDVFHASSRASRTNSTATSRTPCLSRISCRIWRARSRTRRTNSGLRGAPVARWFSTTCKSSEGSAGAGAGFVVSIFAIIHTVRSLST